MHKYNPNKQEKKYNINQIIEMINKAKIGIPIDRFFDENGEHITKKRYGHILLEILCEELKAKYD